MHLVQSPALLSVAALPPFTLSSLSIFVFRNLFLAPLFDTAHNPFFSDEERSRSFDYSPDSFLGSRSPNTLVSSQPGTQRQGSPLQKLHILEAGKALSLVPGEVADDLRQSRRVTRLQLMSHQPSTLVRVRRQRAGRSRQHAVYLKRARQARQAGTAAPPPWRPMKYDHLHFLFRFRSPSSRRMRLRSALATGKVLSKERRTRFDFLRRR